jgi:hypothetical protein
MAVAPTASAPTANAPTATAPDATLGLIRLFLIKTPGIPDITDVAVQIAVSDRHHSPILDAGLVLHILFLIVFIVFL